MRAQAACLLFALSACGEVSGGVTDAHPIDTPGIDGPPVEHWSKIATVSALLDHGNNRGFMAVGLGSKIYFAPIYDRERPQFHAFDTVALALSADLRVPPGTQTDFQASGYGAIFVADADSIYLIGDDAFRYRPDVDTWTLVDGYGDFPYHRGEAAGAWEGNNNAVFMIGGRDDVSNTNQGTAIRRNGDGTWSEEPGALPYTIGNAMAYAPPNDNKTYIAGGDAGDDNRRHLAVHASGTSGWTALADAPGAIDGIGMGHYTAGGVTRIFAASSSKIYFYNPQAAAWDRTIDLPTTDRTRIAMVAGIPYALVQNGDAADVYRMIGID